MYRAETESQAEIAASFIDWGIPTADSILMVKETAPNTPIIASGGLRSGVDIAKTIALGASVGGMAGPFIKAANISAEKVSEVIETVSKQLQITMFASGVKDIPQLKKTKLHKKTPH
jgi:isopentenyl-diphosphate delta-isomerase